MTADSGDAGMVQRALASAAGLLFLAGGSFTLLAGTRALSAIVRSPGVSVFSQRDTLYLAVVTVFAASLLLAGVSLLDAAWRARRHNMVPGPTLYVAGASLLIIALFAVAAGAALPASLAGAAGVALMAAEYTSAHV